MREIRLSGSEGGAAQSNAPLLPLCCRRGSSWGCDSGSRSTGSRRLASAAAVAALTFIREEDLPARAGRLGTWLLERLRQIRSPKVREVRGLGLMVGIELKEKVQPFLVALQEKGVLALPAGPTVLRLLPPLVIEQDDLERVAVAIDEVLAA